jgi:hypothetical protein
MNVFERMRGCVNVDADVEWGEVDVGSEESPRLTLVIIYTMEN